MASELDVKSSCNCQQPNPSFEGDSRGGIEGDKRPMQKACLVYNDTTERVVTRIGSLECTLYPLEFVMSARLSFHDLPELQLLSSAC